MCLRGERRRPAVTQHVFHGQFGPVPRLCAGFRGFGELGIEPEQRGKSRRVARTATHDVAPFFSALVPHGFQEAGAAHVQFLLECTRPPVGLWQTAGLPQPFAQGDVDRAGVDDERSVQLQCFARRQKVRFGGCVTVFGNKFRRRWQKQSQAMITHAFIKIRRSKPGGRKSALAVPQLQRIPRQRDGYL